MPRRPSLDWSHFLIAWLVVLAALTVAGADSAPAPVILHLKNGDRLTGVVLSENSDRLVLSNAWVHELSVPLDQVARREMLATGGTNSSSAIAQGMLQTNRLAGQIKTNHWKGEAQLGLNLIAGATDSYLYYGRIRLAYALPYRSNPRHFFKSDLDYKVDFGKTDGVKSTDRMSGINQTAFDFDGRMYVYSLVGVGYDRIKKIDLQYEAGPGLGYHVIEGTHFTADTEAGIDYQVEYRTGSPDVQDFYYRLAEAVAWRVRDRTSLTEKAEFFPRVNFRGYRIRFESTLAYDVWRHVALNFTVLDLYDTQPAVDVSKNEFQLRSTLGVKF